MTALDLLHGLVLDDGRRWGEVATSWQREDAAAVLEPGEGDPRAHWLGRPKGGSKTTDLAGMSLAWLAEQADPMVDGYAVAADREQAGRLLQRAAAFIARSGLGAVLEVQSRRIVNRRTRAALNALEADVASTEGLLSPWYVVDELPNWADTPTARGMWTSTLSGVPKWPGCRLVVIGHAGDPAHWSRAVLDVALSTGWRVREVPGPLPWITEADLVMQRAMLLPSEFARRHLNVWTSGEDRLASVDDLRACVRLDGPLRPVRGVDYVVALDVGLKHDRTVAVVCHAEPADVDGVRVVSGGLEGEVRHRVIAPPADPWDRPPRREDPGAARGVKIVLDRIEVWAGTRSSPVQLEVVESWIRQAVEAFDGAHVRLDPWQAVGLGQRLARSGVAVQEFTFSSSSVGQLASTLHLLIRNRALVLPDDEELLDELANVRLRETSPGVVRMDHDSGRHDDRALALAMAAHWLLGRAPRPPVRVVVSPRRAGLAAGHRAR